MLVYAHISGKGAENMGMANTARGKLDDESIDLWIREIKTHGEICCVLVANIEINCIIYISTGARWQGEMYFPLSLSLYI